MTKLRHSLLILLVTPALVHCYRVDDSERTTITIIRLAEELHAADSQRERASLPIPLESLKVSGIENGTLRDGKLVFASTGVDTVVTLKRPVDTREYNVLEVVMSVSAGSKMVARWHADAGGHVLAMRKQVTVVPGPEAREYLVPLRDVVYPILRPTLGEIALIPTQAEAIVQIHAVALHYHPVQQPLQWSFEKESYPVISAPNVSWPLSVPNNALFTAGISIVGDQGGEATGIFKMAFVEADGTKHELIHEELAVGPDDRELVPVKSDLSAWQGKQGTLELTMSIDDADSPVFPLWANPRVVERRNDPAKVRPVILISIDTLRPDHLGAYGYERPTSPKLDEFAEEAVVFTNAFSERPFTPMAHMSMLTGLHPRNQMLTQTSNLPDDIETLPSLLSRQGFTCGGFTGHSWWLLPSRGFGRGFDKYKVPVTEFRHIHETLPLVDSWLDSIAGTDFFLFVHSYDVHSKSAAEGYELPYEPGVNGFTEFADDIYPKPVFAINEEPHLKAANFLTAANTGAVTVTRGQIEYLKALYDDSLKMTDQAIGGFLDRLREQPWYQDALIIITSDHGEAFGEHGNYEHIDVYENVIRVPLLVRFPRSQFAGRRVDSVVTLKDIAPTVIEVLGMGGPDMDGRALRAIMEEPALTVPPLFASRDTFRTIRTPDWKFIEDTLASRQELYHIETDPNELENVLRENPEQLGRFARRLANFFAPNREGWLISLYSMDEEVAVELAVSTAGRFALVTAQETEAVEYPGVSNVDSLDTGLNGRTVSANLQLPPRDTDRLLILPTAGDQDIRLSLKATKTAALYTNPDDAPDEATEYNILLHPQAVGDHSRSAFPGDSRFPLSVCVTYEEPEGFLSPAEEVDSQQIEALENLGYGG